jgi:hypothetical protein
MKGKKHLAGSSLNSESISVPAQEPLLPVSQLEPNIAEIKRAEDILEPRVVNRDGKKKPAPKRQPPPVATRRRYGLTRSEVAALLNKPGVREALPQTLCKQYRALAARNATISHLAKENGLSDIGMKELVEGFDGWESQIIAKTYQLYPRFNPCGAELGNSGDGEKVENETEMAQDADIARTGGQSIGGRIVTGGSNSKGLQRKLFDFERSGRIRGTESAGPDHDHSGSRVSEEDNYSENSGDDIRRSE